MGETPFRRIEPLPLEGRNVALIPLSPSHHDGLQDAARDGELWRLWFTTVPSPESMSREIERRLQLWAEGLMAPFTVVEAKTRRIVGMTTYMNIDRSGPRVEIGSTWYARSVQRTGLNTEAKLLLLEHAFDTLDCLAVELRTHFLNRQSRAAIERLGAKLDGVLRAHQRSPDGSIRDTCVYSIVSTEWPAVRSHLRWLLERPR